MKSKNVITAALALLVSTACSGGEKQKVMAKIYQIRNNGRNKD